VDRPVLLLDAKRDDLGPVSSNGRATAPRKVRCWTQVWVTLEETVIGFLIGSVAGVFCGILLGRNKLLSDVFSLYIKIANSIPRVVLGSIFVIALGLGMASKVALAVVMVFFVVFANAFQGVREADVHDRQCADPRRLAAAGDDRSVVIPVGDELDPREPARELRLCAGRCGGRRVPRRQARHRPADLDGARRVQCKRRVRGDDRAGRGGTGSRLPPHCGREAVVEVAACCVLIAAFLSLPEGNAKRRGSTRRFCFLPQLHQNRYAPLSPTVQLRPAAGS
jgi:hypothetical protein